MSWTGYTPAFDIYAKQAGIPLPKAIDELGATIQRGVAEGSLLINEAIGHLAERTWNTMGRPSYRVAPALADALADTDLDLDATFIRFPHPVFGIELPASFDLRNRGGHRLEGLLVSAVREETTQAGRAIGIDAPDGAGDWRFIVLQTWRDEDGAPVVFTLSLKPGDRVGARIREIEANADFSEAYVKRGHDGTITGEDALRRIIALALGSALFAVGANARLVRPVGRPPEARKKRQGRRADRRPPEPRRWVLGADISLPGRADRPAGAGADTDDEDAPGRSLRWSHVRQGHLRLTPTGPRSDRRYVLRYIAPTIVRPDLPLAPRATRHAMDVPPTEGTP